jgi:ferritin-like metal-binding protein YciE
MINNDNDISKTVEALNGILNISILKMSQGDVKSKYVEFINEALSAENAAVDRITSRIDSTPIQELKVRLHQHLEETHNHQDRLRQIVTKFGGEPTDAKADLPKLVPPTTMMMKKMMKDTIKSITDDKKDNPMPEEFELMEIKQDAIAEGAEIIAYETLIAITQRINEIPQEEIISLLKQSLQEEESMKKWYVEKTPMAVDILLPKIISAVSK